MAKRWVRLDVDYFSHPRAIAAGRDGRALHLASICWCGSQLTDGHIPAGAVPTLCQMAGVSRTAVGKVVAAGLWQPTDGHDFYVKDYLDRNPSKGEVEQEREGWRFRQQRKRNRDSHGRYLPDDP